jgi:ADP-ribosylglycohydrolase
MLGAIVGDTVGSIYEFNNTKDYNFEMFTDRSGYTDDSIMTMAVAYWLLKDPKHRYESLEETMVLFAKNCACPNGGYGEMFYIWLFMPWSLKEICPKAYDEDFFPKYDSPDGRVPYNSWGNGSAMRVSAVGWFFETLEETERVAKISAEITHNHPEGIKGAQATAAAIWMARNGKSKADIKEYIETKYEYNLDRTWEYLNQRYGWKSSCQETVPEAIIAFLESSSFEDAIRKAVSMGGDSDTLACITGGIAEAFYGEIPEEMIQTTKRSFPPIFYKVIDVMCAKTAYKTQIK